MGANTTGYIGLTDYKWFSFLRARPQLEEINFWKPSAQVGFKAIPPNAPFFFQLKRPHYAIAGFGYFVRYSKLPIWLAWDSFGEANGAPDKETLKRVLKPYVAGGNADDRHEIGCIMIAEPVFFEEGQWIKIPANWPPNVVAGMKIDLADNPEGRRIWSECLERTVRRRAPNAAGHQSETPRFAEATMVRRRYGQGLFRVMVTEAYGRSCAITTEHSLPTLEAAHIQPYSKDGKHEIANGLLLRSDFHKLLDTGYMTVTPDYRVEISKRLRQDFENGKSYYPFHGKTINLPGNPGEWPSADLLKWHNTEKFLG